MVSGPRWHRPGGVTNGPDEEHSPWHVLRFGPSKGLRVGHTVHRGRQETRLSRKDSLRPTVYPTPVWGTAGVPGYGAGPFVPSGYKWTARTTELHPDGECKHRPPQGETPGEGTRADDKDPPPHPPQPERPGHGTRGTPPQATRKRDRGRRARKGGGRGTHHQQTPARGGGEPHSRDGRGATTHSPHTHTEPPNQAQKGEDRHSNAPPTHRTHACACTQHTPPQPPPTRAPQTHTTHQGASTARTTNATHANPKNKNPATPRQGSCRAPRNTARTQRWTHQALSHEWRAATPSNTQPTTPNPGTRHYDTHTSTATNTQTGRHNTPTSGNTRNQRRHRWQQQRPQHPAQHLGHPHQQRTNTKSHPTLTNDRKQPVRSPTRPAPRTTATSIHTIGNTNTTNNQASTTPSPTPSTPAPSPTKPTHTNTCSSTYITQANGIKHTIAGTSPPSASPPATSATGGNQSHHSR